MIFSTSVGASSGGSATPLSSAVALWVPPLIALGAFLRASVPEAASVGLGVAGSLAMPPLLSSACAALATWPATGSTSFGCDLGSGGCSACFSALTPERAVAVRAAAAGEDRHGQQEDQRATDQKLVLLAAAALVSPICRWLMWPTVGSTRLRRLPCL